MRRVSLRSSHLNSQRASTASCLQVVDDLVLVRVLHVDLASQVSKNVHIHHCFAAGPVKSSPNYDQSVLNLSLVASRLTSLLASHSFLCFCSHHGPFIVTIAQLFHQVKVSLSFNILFNVHDRCENCLLLSLCLFISISDVGSTQVVECGSTANTTPILQMCKVVVATIRVRLRSHIRTFFRCKYPFDSEISILNSMLYPEVSQG